MENESKQSWLPVALIAGALAAWGLLLAVGAYRTPADETAGSDYRKLGVVAAATGLFLLLWGLVLWIRTAKVRRRQRKDS